MRYLLIFLTITIASCKDLQRNFTIDFDDNAFLKDGVRYTYIAGSLHYFRVPEFYWEHRLMKLRAMGANAVQFYVHWYFHEPKEGVYEFDGMKNLTKFIRTAQTLNLDVILRIGPYVCGEEDMGGLPPWLLKYDDIKLRTSDARYLAAVSRWYSVLLPLLRPLLYPNGGPIIMVQLENEYGSYYACDKNYMAWLRGFAKNKLGDSGFVYFTTDGPGLGYLKCGHIDEVYPTVDFGPLNAIGVKYAFAAQRYYTHGKGPAVNSEFYPGWFDMWGGASKSTIPIAPILSTMNIMYAQNASFNFYMAHGGTNFGYSSGAESNVKSGYQQVTTSYDYDAPISESGDSTPKYWAIRQTVEKLKGHEIPYKVPEDNEKFWYGTLGLSYLGSFLDHLAHISDRIIKTTYPLSVEQIDHYTGFTLYHHSLKIKGSVLDLQGVHDRGYVFVDGQLKKVVQRADKLTNNSNINLTLDVGNELTIMVENQGRIGFGSEINDRKGIVKNVTLDGHILKNWSIRPLNMTNIAKISQNPYFIRRYRKKSGPVKLPGFFAGQFWPKPKAGDTFLDTTGWGKGQAFTGHGVNLGRYWPQMGPQLTLYHPYVTTGLNSLMFLELDQPGPQNSKTGDYEVMLINYPKWK